MMKDALSYRLSDEGELEFNRAVAAAKKWIAANANGQIKLAFSIALKLSVPEGESVQEVLATVPLFDENGTPKNGGWRCNRCKTGHHEDCKRGDCTCPSPKHQSAGATA